MCQSPTNSVADHQLSGGEFDAPRHIAAFVHRETLSPVDAGVFEARLRTMKGCLNQICREQRCSGDKSTPGGGWIFVNASVLNSDFANENIATFIVAITIRSGAGCLVGATSATPWPGYVLQHFVESLCCDAGHERLQHGPALANSACAHKTLPTESTIRNADATMVGRHHIPEILLRLASTCNRRTQVSCYDGAKGPPQKDDSSTVENHDQTDRCARYADQNVARTLQANG